MLVLVFGAERVGFSCDLYNDMIYRGHGQKAEESEEGGGCMVSKIKLK